jgi:adenylate cyclase
VKQPVTVYEVSGIAGYYNLFLPVEDEEFFPLVAEIPIHYTILEGKNISNDLFKGRLVALSEKGATIRAENITEGELPSSMANLKLNLITLNTPTQVSEDIYAKVLEKLAPEGNFYIRFTAIPPALQMRLDKIYQSVAARK